jgi:hypothetical protein
LEARQVGVGQEQRTTAQRTFTGGKHTAADVVAKAQAVLSEATLLRAMFDVGYFPPNMPPA